MIRRRPIRSAIRIRSDIHLVRGDAVMLDADLARVYGVSTKRLNEQVKRNIMRFPRDFMFQLTRDEWANLRSHIATSSLWGGRRTRPYAFPEHGAVMLAAVLDSATAVDMSVEVVRAFVRMRKMLSSQRELAHRVDELEREIGRHDRNIGAIFQAIRQLMSVPVAKRPRRIGF